MIAPRTSARAGRRSNGALPANGASSLLDTARRTRLAELAHAIYTTHAGPLGAGATDAALREALQAVGLWTSDAAGDHHGSWGEVYLGNGHPCLLVRPACPADRRAYLSAVALAAVALYEDAKRSGALPLSGMLLGGIGPHLATAASVTAREADAIACQLLTLAATAAQARPA